MTTPQVPQTLRTIAEDALALEALIFEQSGELDATLERWLGEVGQSLTRKVDSYQFTLERFETTAKMLKARASQITAAARTLENTGESLRLRIKEVMRQTGLEEAAGTDFKFKLVYGAARAVIDEKQVEARFFKPVTTHVLDKEALIAAAKTTKEGEAFPSGIHFEPTFQLRSYVKKG